MQRARRAREIERHTNAADLLDVRRNRVKGDPPQERSGQGSRLFNVHPTQTQIAEVGSQIE